MKFPASRYLFSLLIGGQEEFNRWYQANNIEGQKAGHIELWNISLWSNKNRCLKVLQDSNGGHGGQVTSFKIIDFRVNFSQGRQKYRISGTY